MVNLDDEEEGILKYLGREDESVEFSDITRYLARRGYEETTNRAITEKLNHLIEVGYVRSKAEGKGNKREEKFYLARRLGGGGRKRKQLQGRGIIYDTSKLVQRLFGSVFLLIGFGFLVYQGLSITGAFISSAQPVVPTFVFAFALFLIGGFLLKKSLHKE